MSIATNTASPEQHGAKAHSDGGWDSNEPGYVPVQTRDARFTSFEHDDFTEVKGYENDWKLTPVARVRPLIDEALDGSPYAYLVNEAAGATVEWVDREDARIGSAGTPEDRGSANAWSSFEKALSVTLTSEEHVDLVLSRSQLGSAPRAAPRSTPPS